MNTIYICCRSIIVLSNCSSIECMVTPHRRMTCLKHRGLVRNFFSCISAQTVRIHVHCLTHCGQGSSLRWGRITQATTWSCTSEHDRGHFVSLSLFSTLIQQYWNYFFIMKRDKTKVPINRNEVKRREVWECDGWVCDLEAIGAPSMFRLIRKAAVLTRMWPNFDLNCEENATRR